jgi:hypothetical protein
MEENINSSYNDLQKCIGKTIKTAYIDDYSYVDDNVKIAILIFTDNTSVFINAASPSSKGIISAKFRDNAENSVTESINEDIQVLDKVNYKNQSGYINGQIGDKFIVQIQGSTYLVDPKELKEYNEKPKVTTKPHMKFDDKTQALLFEQYVKCGVYYGNVPVRLNDCFVKYNHYENAKDDQQIKIIIEGSTTFMPKNQIRILENLNDFANPDNYIPGVLIDEVTDEAIQNVLINALDYTQAIGNADGVRIIIETPDGSQEMQNAPKSKLKTLSV